MPVKWNPNIILLPIYDGLAERGGCGSYVAQHDPGAEEAGRAPGLPVPWPHEIWTRSSKAEELRGWDLGYKENQGLNYGTAFTGSV